MMNAYLNRPQTVTASTMSMDGEADGVSIIVADDEGGRVTILVDQDRCADILAQFADALTVAEAVTGIDVDWRKQSPEAVAAVQAAQADVGRRGLLLLQLLTESGPDALQLAMEEVLQVLRVAGERGMIDSQRPAAEQFGDFTYERIRARANRED